MYNACRERIDKINSNNNTLHSEIAAYPFAKGLRKLIEIFTKWLSVRDYTAFFEQVVADCDEAQRAMDDSRRIREFCNEQLTRYKECCQFARDNEANWGDLDDAAQHVAEEFKAILVDEEPMNRLPNYLQQKRMLNAKLEEVKNNLRQRIEQAYRDTEQQLINIAAEQGVEYHSRASNVVAVKQGAQNIANLKLNCDTDDYYREEVEKILSAAQPSRPTTPQPTPQSDPESQSQPTPPSTPQPAPAPRYKPVRLATRSISILASASDVDAYLSNLRQQLMNHIDRGEDIMVM
jgi:hypothetical protein